METTYTNFSEYIKTLQEETATADIAPVDKKIGDVQKRPKNPKRLEHDIVDDEDENDSESKEDIEKKIIKNLKDSDKK